MALGFAGAVAAGFAGRGEEGRAMSLSIDISLLSLDVRASMDRTSSLGSAFRILLDLSGSRRGEAPGALGRDRRVYAGLRERLHEPAKSDDAAAGQTPRVSRSCWSVQRWSFGGIRSGCRLPARCEAAARHVAGAVEDQALRVSAGAGAVMRTTGNRLRVGEESSVELAMLTGSWQEGLLDRRRG